MKHLIHVSAYVALVESRIDLSDYAELVGSAGCYQYHGIDYVAGEPDKLLKAEKRHIVDTIFSSEYCNQYNIRRFGNSVVLAKEYLQGLPSVCSLPFMNYDIIQWAEKQLGRELSEAEAEALLCVDSGYWYQCGKAFMLILSNKA